MTKTFTTDVPHRLANPGSPVMLPMAKLQTDRLFGILNLGHWDLFEICYLVLGIFIKPLVWSQ
jgi:hypothetical protein